jgi:Mycothiol maleylpyruvate isomerase N-terminal domain
MNGTGSASPPLTDTRDARRALAAAARRNAEVIGSVDLDLPVKGSEWSVGETASHLVIALRGFTASAIGEYGAWYQWEDRIPNVRTPERLEALNRAMIAAEPKLRPAAAARATTDSADAFLAATDALPPDQDIATPWYGPDTTLTVAQATCLLLGEQVLHGYDIAKAVGRRPSISKQDAVLIFAAVQAMLPKMADPTAIRGVTATYELHLAGAGRSGRFIVRIADGAAVVEPCAGQRVDCHVLAEPVALMLLGYGRINQWQAIGRAKMITWGTKPWLAFRFTSFFSNP